MIKALKTFFNNIRYLFRYNIKEINKNALSQIDIFQLTELAAIKSKYMFDKIIIPEMKDDYDTISELINTDKSIIRYGDGEFYMIEGRDIPYQNYYPEIGETLKEIFYNDDKNMLTGTKVDCYRLSPKHVPIELENYKMQWFLRYYKFIESLYNPTKIYYSAQIGLPFTTYKGGGEGRDFEAYFNEIKKIWNNKKITIIVGDRVFKNIQYNIFDNAKEINYIYGPTTNAWEEHEKIEKNIEQVSKDNILVFALGPAGKVIAYKMFKKGYRVLDLGHLIKSYDVYEKSKSMTKKQLAKAIKEFYKPD